jgi:hypothetical protein
MDTSLSIDSNLAADLQHRDRLFYDRWEWCLHFGFGSAGCLRPKADTWAAYVRKIDRLWLYRNTSFLSLQRRGINKGGSWVTPEDQAVMSRQYQDLLDLADMLWQNRDRIKLVVFRTWVYVYTNDLDLLDQLRSRPYLHSINVRRAIVDRPKGVILRHQPRHGLRTFLKARRYTDSQKASLKSWLSAQTDIRISPGLSHWLQEDWNWCREYYWIDHDDPGVTLMLELLCTNSIGATRQILSINNIS